MPITVTLVHGTWARKSKWPALEKVLQALPGVVHVDYARWSGGNSVHARQAGAACVRSHLNSVIKDFPHADHYLIAHSHGGNVALAALNDLSLRARIRGLICLSTPFLNASRRDVRLGYLLQLALGIGVGCGLITHLLGWSWASLLAVATPVCLAAALWKPLLRYRDFVDRAMSRLDQSDIHLLIIRSPEDEASFTLATAQAMCWLSARVWLTASRLLWAFNQITLIGEKANSVKEAIRNSAFLWVAVALHIGGFWLWAIYFPDGYVAKYFWWLVGIFGGTLVAIAAASLLLTAAVFLLVSLVVVGLAAALGLFGWDLPPAALFLNVAAEPAPPGAWVVYQLPPPSDSNSGLLHSVTYTDGRALTKIGDWLLAQSSSVGRHC